MKHKHDWEQGQADDKRYIKCKICNKVSFTHRASTKTRGAFGRSRYSSDPVPKKIKIKPQRVGWLKRLWRKLLKLARCQKNIEGKSENSRPLT